MVNDAYLELMKRQPDPIERFAKDQGLALTGWMTSIETLSATFLKTGSRLVVLDCGHLSLSRGLHRARCARCGAMIRAGYDYDGFRNGGVPDAFSWPEDTLWILHEGHRHDSDLACRPATLS